MNWISVKTELPKRSGSYLVVGKSDAVHISHFYGPRTLRDGTMIPPTWSNKHVTHWMPLPAAPERSKE